MLQLGKRSKIRQQLAKPNYLAVYRVLWQHGPITRNQITELTNLALPTVCRIVKDLMSQGLIHCVDELESMGGRPPGRLAVTTTGSFLIGIDLGGTKLAGILIDLDANILASQFEPVEQGGIQPLSDAIQRLIKGLISKAGVELDRIIGIGLSVPGAINRSQGLVVEAANLKVSNWRVVENVEKLFKIPVHIENDANAAALGEIYFGDGQLGTNLVYVNVGTGIGMGLIIDGHVFRGDSGHAGELGHVVFDFDGPLCSCGKHGCLEAYAGGWAIVQNYRRELDVLALEVEGDSCGGPQTAEDVFRRFQEGDPIAKAVLARASDALGRALSNLIYLLGIQHVILGGGIIINNNRFFEDIRERAFSLIPAKFHAGIRIVKTKLGKYVGVLGAAAIVLQDLFDIQVSSSQRERVWQILEEE